MSFGASTSNEDIAKALDELLLELAGQVESDNLDLIEEAATRIRELGDD